MFSKRENVSRIPEELRDDTREDVNETMEHFQVIFRKWDAGIEMLPAPHFRNNLESQGIKIPWNPGNSGNYQSW